MENQDNETTLEPVVVESIPQTEGIPQDTPEVVAETMSPETVDELRTTLNHIEKHQKKMLEILLKIDNAKNHIDSLSEEIKDWKKKLECFQKELNNQVRKGPDEQLTFDLIDEEKDEEKTEQPPVLPEETWKKQPVSALENLTDNEIEKLSENFENCGEVCDWIGSDFSKKIKGLGEKSREKIRNAIDKIAGITDEIIRAEAERGKAEREKLESTNHVERDPEEVRQFLERVDGMICDPRQDYALNTLEGIKAWVEEHKCYTFKQLMAVTSIENGETPEPWTE